MDTALNKTTWGIINSVNYQLQEEEKAQKRGQEHIAQAHHTKAKHRVAKDYILPSAGDNKAAKTGKEGEG